MNKLEYNRAWRKRHPGYQQKWRAKNLSKCLANERKYHNAHREERNKASREYNRKNRVHNSQVNKLYRRNNRLKVLSHYSNGNPRCVCCGEREIAFLVIDHIRGGGNDDRKIRGEGTAFIISLIKEGFPPGFQVLCYNCNMAKHTEGRCPHNRRG